MTTATAAVVGSTGEPFVLQEIEVDDPRTDEVLVRIVATGMCHTDLAARGGGIPFPLPGVLGHEAAGVIEQVGDSVVDIAVGDHASSRSPSAAAAGSAGPANPPTASTGVR